MKATSEVEEGRNDFCSLRCSVSHTNMYKDKSGMKNTGCMTCGKESAHSKFAPAVKCDACKKARGNEIVQRRCLCGVTFETQRKSSRKFCSPCKKEVLSKNGRLQGVSRSKNEILFASMCLARFSNVQTNVPIFNEWDADVIIHDLKIAILWNGPWHRKKIKSKHSVLQVQNRDRIKMKEIQKAGYRPYVIDDPGKANPVFVEREFSRFVDMVRRDGIEPST